MGGFGSGRYGGRPTTESGLTPLPELAQDAEPGVRQGRERGPIEATFTPRDRPRTMPPYRAIRRRSTSSLGSLTQISENDRR